MNLRSALREIVHELGLKGQYTYDEVINELRSRYPGVIAAEARKLETIALKRILSDVEARQTRSYNANQSELFPELVGFPEAFDARPLGLSDQKGVRILLQLMPIRVVREVANYTKPPKKNSSPQSKLKNYLEELSPHVRSDEEMFGDVIKRSRA